MTGLSGTSVRGRRGTGVRIVLSIRSISAISLPRGCAGYGGGMDDFLDSVVVAVVDDHVGPTFLVLVGFCHRVCYLVRGAFYSVE